jgi:hypothetical protein
MKIGWKQIQQQKKKKETLSCIVFGIVFIITLISLSAIAAMYY